MALEKKLFGKTASGETVYCYRLYGKENAYVEFLDYGARIHSICVPDKNGVLRDVSLGYDTIEDYETKTAYIGATVGRVCNRIGNSAFTLNGKTYNLYANDGKNHLHGGKIGFDKKVWQSKEENDSIIFTYVSPDGEEGYPGTLTVTVTYTFDQNNKLTILHKATTDKDTLCALTNHCYFNLGGYDSGDVLSHILTLNADSFTKADAESIPHGEIASVKGTPMDFTTPTPIGKNINNTSCEQIRFGKGYDHNWVLNKSPIAASVYVETTGIQMDMTTTLPGVQFYTANFLDGSNVGKNNVTLSHRCGFCLETQYFPNAINVDNFEKPILKAGDVYEHKTTYQFSIKK